MNLISRAGIIPPALHRASLLIVISITALFFSGCSNRIPEDEFKKIYTDLILAQDSLGRDKQITEQIKQSLYKKHKVTKEQFDKTVEYYKANPEKWEAFYNDLITETEKKVNATQQH